MGWDNVVALTKVKQAYGSDAQAIRNAITTMYPGGDTESCNLTFTVLQQVVCPGRAPKSAAVKDGKVSVNTALSAMDSALDGDEVIFVALKPDHFFLVLPLTGDQVAILQGFEGSYTLYDWLNNGTIPMGRGDFMTNFRKLFSGTVSEVQDGAEALFSIAGQEAAVRHWFGRTANIAGFATMQANLFKDGSKAALAAPQQAY